MEIKKVLINTKNISYVSYERIYYSTVTIRLFIHFIGSEHCESFKFDNEEDFKKVWEELKEKL